MRERDEGIKMPFDKPPPLFGLRPHTGLYLTKVLVTTRTDSIEEFNGESHGAKQLVV
jgi:hypothetical protein